MLSLWVETKIICMKLHFSRERNKVEKRRRILYIRSFHFISYTVVYNTDSVTSLCILHNRFRFDKHCKKIKLRNGGMLLQKPQNEQLLVGTTINYDSAA